VGYFYLLFRLLERNVFAELCAVLLKLDLAGDELLVFASPIDLSGSLVAQLYKIIL